MRGPANRVQIKTPRHVEVVQVSQIAIQLIHHHPITSIRRALVVGLGPPSSVDWESCIWAGTGSAADMRCHVILRVISTVSGGTAIILDVKNAQNNVSCSWNIACWENKSLRN